MKEEINLVKILELILKLWWVILIFAIVGALVTFSISSFFITPMYTSSSNVYVSGSEKTSGNGVNLNDITVSQRLVGTYIEILSSNSFLDDVATEYNKTPEGMKSPVSAGRIKSGLDMSSANETEILQIKYDDISPQMAQDILTKLVEMAPDKIQSIIKGCDIKVVDHASLPVAPSSPNIKQNTFVGLFLGIVLGIAIIFFKEVFDTRIKDDEELKAKYNVAVLGIIPNLDVN